MKASTIWHKKWFRRAFALLFWMLVWQIVSLFTPKWLFAGPVPTVQSLLFMLKTNEFWLSLFLSIGKIAAGFALAFIMAGILAVLSHVIAPIKVLLEPAVQIMKSVPVACFIVVALIWIHSSSISILTSFFVVFPVVYINLLEGLCHPDFKMLEMARVFQLHPSGYLKAVWLPALMPYVFSSCKVAVGMALKAGIAGEIIGLPYHSIGEQLYLSKLYLNVSDLFAWSIVIILLSMLLEKLLLKLAVYAQKRWGMVK